MKAHEYWFSHYGVRRNPGIFLCLFDRNKYKYLTNVLNYLTI